MLVQKTNTILGQPLLEAVAMADFSCIDHTSKHGRHAVGGR
jgi:hypothetical protein